MGLYQIIAIFLFFGVLSAQEPNRVLYLLRQGHFQSAFDQYLSSSGEHDFHILQEIGLTMIELGWKCSDPEIQLLSLYGAGISVHDRAELILESAISSNDPKLQLVALNFLSKNYASDSSRFLIKAMGSKFLPIRLEAAFHLASNQHPQTAYQLESLMQKLPQEALPLFPQLLGACGDKDSISKLKRLMSHPLLEVRLESILSAAKNKRDDLLPEIRTIATHHQPQELEASASALGILKDEQSIQKLNKLANASFVNVQIAALQALGRMGRENVNLPLINIAKSGNLFAITALGELSNTENALFELCKKGDLNIRLNAAIALLERRDQRSLPFLLEFLIKNPRDLAIIQFSSAGKALKAFKAVPSAQQNFETSPLIYERSLLLKEKILEKTLDLPEPFFIKFCAVLLEKHQNELIPTITHLLESKQTHDSISLLKQCSKQIGAPLLRNWSSLALYRLNEPGPYKKNLKSWIRKYQHHDLIQFRPLLTWKMRADDSLRHQLTPQEASRLLVETFESLVQQQDKDGIHLIIDTIKNGNRKNRYALAGLLIRATN